MLRVQTTEEVIAKYGDPAKYLREDGSVGATWENLILDSFTLPKPIPLAWGGVATKISCHKLVKPELDSLFKKLAQFSNVWDTITDYGGCYNFRQNRFNSSSVSRHAWGIAIDIDVKHSPHPLIIQGFYDVGWIWGGWFSKPDAMHFEKAALL
jgi:hypothetical protein